MEERPVDPVAVDTSLIDEMLRLSPADRLRQNDRMAALAVRLQGAFSVREQQSAREEQWSNRET